MKLRNLTLAAASLAFFATAGPALALAEKPFDPHLDITTLGLGADLLDPVGLGAAPVDYAMLDVCLMTVGGEPGGENGGDPPADPPAPQPDDSPKPGDPPADPPAFHLRC